MTNLSKEDEYLYYNSLKFFIIISVLFITISFMLINPEIFMILLESRKNITNEKVLEIFNTCRDVNLVETISLSAIQILITVNMIKSLLKDDIKQIVITIKYFSLFMIVHICYFLLSAFIL